MSNPLLKDYLSPKFYEQFLELASDSYPNLDAEKYKKLLFDDSWKSKELMDRVQHSAVVLHEFMPEHFPDAVQILVDISETIREHKEEFNFGFGFMLLNDYVKLFGLDYPDEALNTFEQTTQLISSEFAIRPFIQKYPEKVLKQMFEWSNHPSEDLRRLSSEGCRPRLPWGMALKFLQDDPSHILPILENLKDDESESVRRSVANNLNDISKDHPDIALDTCLSWMGHSKETDWIVKHACRSLLKQGHPKALKLFGYSDTKGIQIEQLKLEKDNIKIGEDAVFSFVLKNTSRVDKHLRIEYGVDFMKASGKPNRKVFMITENSFEPECTVEMRKKQTFKQQTTRKIYSGKQTILILVNGEEMASVDLQVSE